MKNNRSQIKINQVVKGYQYGRTLEMTSAKPHRPGIQRLPNGKYVVLATGELRQIKKVTSSRVDNVKQVRATFRRLSRLVEANFEGGHNELWLTLTFRTFTDDTKIVYSSFKAFIAKVRRRHGKDLEYIAVLEPQASGSFHLHVLMKAVQQKQLFIANDEVAELWGQGFTTTKRLKKSDNVAAYLLAYLSNVPVEFEKNGEKTKRFIKGERLHYYSAGTNIYRASRGLKKPLEITDYKRKILDEFGLSDEVPDSIYSSTHDTPNGPITFQTEFFRKIDEKKDSQK